MTQDTRVHTGVAGILLAAGAGSRFGGRKLLQRLPDGTMVGVASLHTLSTALGQVTAVTRPGDDELAQALESHGARVIVCDEAHLGMGHSLACAIAHTPADLGWVVALADMPVLRPTTIAAVADTLSRTQCVVVPVFNGTRGHPVGFPSRLRDELCELRGDEGARALLQREGARLVRIEVDDPGVLRDVDTPADLDALAQTRGGATA